MLKYYLVFFQVLVILCRELFNLSIGWWEPLHNNTDRTIVNYICQFSLLLCTYLANYYLVAPLLLKKQYKRYILFLIILLGTAGAGALTLDYLFYEGTFPYHLHFFYAGLNVSFYFFISTGFSLISKWQQANIQKRDLLNEKKKAELQLLKSQINPHFLFNILNSIYALSLKKSAKTTSALEKLNSILHYMTDSAGKDFILLEEEINYLKDLIELQKLRMKYPDNLSFAVEVADSSVKIPPLLLLPLVENCFKHGNISIKAANIRLKLKQKGKEVSMRTENDLKQVAEITGGIGLENLTLRLDALYSGDHTLQVKTIGTKFIAELKFPLIR